MHPVTAARPGTGLQLTADALGALTEQAERMINPTARDSIF